VAIAYLRLRPRGAPGETLVFNDELTLGRTSLGKAAFEDVKMSRQHARFYFEGDGGVWVQDLSSTNGTFVNGARIDRACRLALGDQIRLSSTMLELVAASADAPASAPAPAPAPAAATSPPELEARVTALEAEVAALRSQLAELLD
jgi:predicted component of type VI protein secretion system